MDGLSRSDLLMEATLVTAVSRNVLDISFQAVCLCFWYILD